MLRRVTQPPHIAGPLGCNNVKSSSARLPQKGLRQGRRLAGLLASRFLKKEGRWDICRIFANPAHANFCKAFSFVPFESSFFNLYFSRLAPMLACRWKVMEILKPVSNDICKLSKILSKPLFSVNMKDSVLSFTAANTDNAMKSNRPLLTKVNNILLL
jgi:hypothetical protein